MKITIVGGGNMGGAIAKGLMASRYVKPYNVTVINRRQEKADEFKAFHKDMNAVVNDYSSLSDANIVIVALKPWLVDVFLNEYKTELSTSDQILVSVASGIGLSDLDNFTSLRKPLYRVMPNTAIALQQSMTFVSSLHTSVEQDDLIISIFSEMGKAQLINESLFAAGTSLASCGIAYAFRYIRAAMEGGVELGFYPDQAKEAVIQTLRGALELLEANNTHPEQEIDKVTTAGGITIKGLNEMEHAGFTSSIIKGLKASCIKST